MYSTLVLSSLVVCFNVFPILTSALPALERVFVFAFIYIRSIYIYGTYFCLSGLSLSFGRVGLYQ